MKKLYFIVILAVLFSELHAQQQLFTQDFENGGVLTDYILDGSSATTNNKFSNITPHSDVTVSITDNKLRFSRASGAAGGANANAASWVIGGTVTGGNAHLNPVPAVMEFGMKFQITESDQSGLRMFLTAGTGISNDARSPQNNAIHSGIMIETTDNAGGFKVIRGTFDHPLGNGNSKPAVGPYTGEVEFKWIVNNSGDTYTYTVPGGATTTEVANDTWDLYINNVLVLDDEPTVVPSGTGGAKDKDITTLKFSIRRNSAGPLTVDMDNISVTALLTSLPVSLTSFTGTNAGDYVKLNWNTVSEHQNSHFDILRSADGKIFHSIATVKGNGTSNQQHTYSYTDFSPLTGINYYQLKQVDIDGRETVYPEIVSVKSSIMSGVFKALVLESNLLKFSVYAENSTTGDFSILDIHRYIRLSFGHVGNTSMNVIARRYSDSLESNLSYLLLYPFIILSHNL